MKHYEYRTIAVTYEDLSIMNRANKDIKQGWRTVSFQSDPFKMKGNWILLQEKEIEDAEVS